MGAFPFRSLFLNRTETEKRRFRSIPLPRKRRVYGKAYGKAYGKMKKEMREKTVFRIIPIGRL